MIGIMHQRIALAMLVLFAISPHGFGQTVEPWATYRANPQRSASDGQPGPASSKVLWVLKSGKDSKLDSIASPVPLGNKLYVSGLGAFNTGYFACLSTEPNAKTRTLWAKS